MKTYFIRARMIEKGLTYEAMAARLGISVSAFQKKMSGKTELTLSEIQGVIEALEWDRETAFDVFFGQKVS